MRIKITKIKAGYWVIDRYNGRTGYDWGGTLNFCESFEEAWLKVFGVRPR